MPGRLEFEHEVENDAELAVKDMEFGLVWKYGGDEQPASQPSRPVDAGDDNDEGDDDETETQEGDVKVKEEPMDDVQAHAEGSRSRQSSSALPSTKRGKGKAKAEPVFDVEDEDELEVKLALLDIYFSKLDRREEAKDLIFDRGLTEHKRVSSEP